MDKKKGREENTTHDVDSIFSVALERRHTAGREEHEVNIFEWRFFCVCFLYFPFLAVVKCPAKIVGSFVVFGCFSFLKLFLFTLIRSFSPRRFGGVC